MTWLRALAVGGISTVLAAAALWFTWHFAATLFLDFRRHPVRRVPERGDLAARQGDRRQLTGCG
ncbi:MAG: hypothetical protein MZV49_26270 [Rhodopseudomonas palustris]|nr:hypothetical protein [Rhodopseudomonas palustris]